MRAERQQNPLAIRYFIVSIRIGYFLRRSAPALLSWRANATEIVIKYLALLGLPIWDIRRQSFAVENLHELRGRDAALRRHGQRSALSLSIIP